MISMPCEWQVNEGSELYKVSALSLIQGEETGLLPMADSSLQGDTGSVCNALYSGGTPTTRLSLGPHAVDFSPQQRAQSQSAGLNSGKNNRVRCKPVSCCGDFLISHHSPTFYTIQLKTTLRANVEKTGL